MAKRFRLLRRRDDGSATFESSDDSGYALLFEAKDGSRFIHEVEGICPDCVMARHAKADCPRQARQVSPRPVQDPAQPDIPAPKPAPPAATPRRTLLPAKPAPDPADEQLERDALAVARSVWNRGGRHRHAIFQGQSTTHADAVLRRAVERQWVTVSADGIVSPGTVNPAPVMPDTRSRREKALAWGPGPGTEW